MKRSSKRRDKKNTQKRREKGVSATPDGHRMSGTVKNYVHDDTKNTNKKNEDKMMKRDLRGEAQVVNGNPGQVKKTNKQSKRKNGKKQKDDCFVKPGSLIIQPIPTRRYGDAKDYPDGTIPVDKDGSEHPDKIFPKGRPYWMVPLDNSRPIPNLTIEHVVGNIKRGKKWFEGPKKKPSSFDPYADFNEMQAKDAEFSAEDTIYRNTFENIWSVSCAEPRKPKKAGNHKRNFPRNSVGFRDPPVHPSTRPPTRPSTRYNDP